MKKEKYFIIILAILLIPFSVSAAEIQFTFYANGGTTSTPNFSIYEDYGFISYNGISNSSYTNNSTIKNINSIKGNKFIITKKDDYLVAGKEWYMKNYYDGKTYFFSENSTYKMSDIIKQLGIEDINFVSYSLYANWNSKKKTSGTNIKAASTNSKTKEAEKKDTSKGKHTVNIRYHTNKGTLVSPHSSQIKVSNNYIYNKDAINATKIIYNEKMENTGLANYDNPTFINIQRNGYIAKKGAEWNTKADGSGKSYSQRKVYKASDFCNASKKDCTITLYVNWEPIYKEKVSNELTITAIDYKSKNHGDAVLLKSKDSYLLMDTTVAYTNTIVEYLDNHNIKNLDIYLSHYHGDHYNGFYKIIKNKSKYNIQKIYMPEPTESSKKVYEQLASTAKKYNIKVIKLTKGSTFKFGYATGKVIYHQKGKNYDENDHSLVTIITCGNIRYFTAGDITQKVENELIKNNIDVHADIMKLSHHGVQLPNSISNTLGFIKKVNPKYVFYQYNHTSSQNYNDGWLRYGDSETYFALKSPQLDYNNRIKYETAAYTSVQNVQSLNRATYSTRYNGNIEFKIKNSRIDSIKIDRNRKRIIINYVLQSKNNSITKKVFDVNNQSKYTIYDYKRNFPNYSYKNGYENIKTQNHASNINNSTLEYIINYN